MKPRPARTKSSAKVRQSAPKLASGATSRSGFEWIGATPDARVPPRVQLRILDRQAGKCAATGRKFRVGDPKRLDHIKPLADGGAHAEGNLQWILDATHKAKTRAEAAVRKTVRAKAKAHAGIKRPPARPLESRNDLAQRPKPKVAKLPTPTGPSNLERRYGIVEKPRRR